MTRPRSKIGLTFAGLYLSASVYLIGTQGLFGESFIAVFLGLPWSYLIVLLEHHKLIPRIPETHPLFYPFLRAELLAPIGANAILLYWIGVGIQRVMTALVRHGVPRRNQ